MTDPLRHTASVVEALGSALRSADHGLGTVPALLRQVLADGAWREFVTQRGDHVTHDRFEQFVQTPPLRGLGADMDLVRRIAASDTTTLDLLDRAVQNPSSKHAAGDNVTSRPDGNTAEKALRRLRKDRPDLHEQVLAGAVSAHGAMVKAGFRKRTQSVPVDDPEAVARALRRHMDPDALTRLVKLLVAGQEEGWTG